MSSKPLKIVFVLLSAYLMLVVLFESSLGYFQPESDATLQITTLNAEGVANRRVVARLESGDQLFVAANHWPRTWYREALANPVVQVSSERERGSFIAVSVEGIEHERVNAENPLGLMFRMLTGFPPRYFLRLEPAN